MNRRESLKRGAYLLGGVLFVSSLDKLLLSCNGNTTLSSSDVFTSDRQRTLEALVDTFIPDSNVLGAVEVGVVPFISIMLADCYEAEVRELFGNGLNQLDEVADSQYHVPFDKLDLNIREGILKESTDESLKQFYRLAFELTCVGYYTSEYVAIQVLGYDHVPGTYEPCETITNNVRG